MVSKTQNHQNNVRPAHGQSSTNGPKETPRNAPKHTENLASAKAGVSETDLERKEKPKQKKTKDGLGESFGTEVMPRT